MKNSRFTVATHILSILSFLEQVRPGTTVKSHEIAESVNTNPVIIRRILAKLRDAGLVQIHGGSSGGARLNRNPDKITLLDVHRAIDEGEIFALHTNRPSEKCPIGSTIKPILADVFGEIDGAIDEVLKAQTIGDLVLKMQLRYAENDNTSFEALFRQSQMQTEKA